MATVYPAARFEVEPGPLLAFLAEPAVIFNHQEEAALAFQAAPELLFSFEPFEAAFTAETNHFIDENGNALIDENGDYIVW